MEQEVNRERFREFIDRYDTHYGLNAHDLFIHESISTVLSENLEKGKVIDVGCGTGSLLSYLAERHFQFTYSGIDISEDMIEKSKEKLPDAEFFVGDVYQLSSTEPYDAILLKHAFHHFTDANSALEGLKRILKPGGLMIIGDILGFKDDEANRQYNAIDRIREPANAEFRNEKTMLEVLTNNNFSVVALEKGSFQIVIEKWLAGFKQPEKTIPAIVNSSNQLKEAMQLSELPDGTHQATFHDYVLVAKLQ